MFLSEAINVPVRIIENMAYYTPEELPDNKYYLFGKEGAKLSRRFRVHLGEEYLLYNPYAKRRLRSSCSDANSICSGEHFDEVTRNVVQETVNRNENLPASGPLKLLQWQAVQQLKKK
jgi:ATP-binding protein involved in chromosome partitioning